MANARSPDAVEVTWANFEKIVTRYEDEIGRDIPGMYRDNRGVIYTPHTGEEIPLGTLNVEQYRRPEWTFNKILYIEKEGFFQILKDEKWPESHDCALMTSKGFASRAARDIIDLLGETGEEITVFFVHDADAFGTMIYQSLQESTKARPALKLQIINLGLEPREALKLGLRVEPVERKRTARASSRKCRSPAT
jgi:DNA topoisomerase VI subunit A